MTQHYRRSFSVPFIGEDYSKNWEEIFRQPPDTGRLWRGEVWVRPKGESVSWQTMNRCDGDTMDEALEACLRAVRDNFEPQQMRILLDERSVLDATLR